LKKGIVISPIFHPLPNGVSIRGGIDPYDLRKYLLYWDEIDLADNNLVSVGSEDIDFLIGLGAAKRTRIEFRGEFLVDGRIFLAAQEIAWQKNEVREPGCWSLAQSSTQPYFPDGIAQKQIEFELYNVVPVPTSDVHLEDILNFKERRSEELLAFRCHLNDIYQNILRAGDMPTAKTIEVARLANSIKDLNNTLQESAIRRGIGSLRSSISSEFTGFVGIGLAYDTISKFIPLPPTFAGVMVCGITIGVKHLMSPKAVNNSTPLTYLRSIHENF